MTSQASVSPLAALKQNNKLMSTMATSAPPSRPPDAYSRHPFRGPLYRQNVVGAPGVPATFVPIDAASPAFRNAHLNAHHSPFINVHSGHGAIDGRIPPRRPRMPHNFRHNTLPDNLPGSLATGGLGARGRAGQGTGGDHMWSHSPFSQAASRVLIVNPMHIVNLSEHTKSRLIRFIETIKKFSEKWFSHVLLLLFLAIYACFGAYVFMSFEGTNEHYEKQMIIDMRMKIVNDSWNARDRLKVAYFELLRMRFEEYEHLLNKACAMGMSGFSLDNQWTFWGALFYSMTVFTTIGYGHLTPVTFAGRIATMIYAIFGIPILLMVLADVGKLLTRAIKYCFNKIRLVFWRLFKRKGAQKTRKMISDNTNQYIGVARDAFEKGFAHIPYVPQKLRSNSINKQQLSKQSPYMGDNEQQKFEPTLPEGENETTSVIVTSSAPTPAVSPDVDTHSGKHQPHLLSSHDGSGGSKKRRNSGKKNSIRDNSLNNKKQIKDSDGTTVVDDTASLDMTSSLSKGDEQQEGQQHSGMDMTEAPPFEDIDDEFDLPVSVALTLLVMYMMFGAIMFSTWEGWNFFDSLYFVFISMSTIGFGDLVPQHPKRMMATFIYLLFGLALTSMCINVVQEKIHATFLRAKMQIGEKMGLDLEQIMADDYYEDGYEDDEDDTGHMSSHDGNDTDDIHKTSLSSSSVAAAANRQPSASNSTTNSEPSSANNSMKGRKKSTGSSSGKEDKKKNNNSSFNQHQQQDKKDPNRKISSAEAAATTAAHHQRNNSKSPAPMMDKQQNYNDDNSNSTSKSKPSLTTQPGIKNNKQDIDEKIATTPAKLNKSTYELKMQPLKKQLQDTPVIDQLDEPMPPSRSRWGSGKFSNV